MRTRLYCSALLPPCMGVLIAQATGGNELQCLLPAVYVYPVCSYMSVQYTMQYRRPYSKLNRCYFFGFPGKRIAKRAWSARYLPASGVYVWRSSLALPFPVRSPEKREKNNACTVGKIYRIYSNKRPTWNSRPASNKRAPLPLPLKLQSAPTTKNPTPFPLPPNKNE